MGVVEGQVGGGKDEKDVDIKGLLSLRGRGRERNGWVRMVGRGVVEGTGGRGNG